MGIFSFFLNICARFFGIDFCFFFNPIRKFFDFFCLVGKIAEMSLRCRMKLLPRLLYYMYSPGRERSRRRARELHLHF
jgi:hypothetical protein